MRLQFSHSLGIVHKCFWRRGLILMRNHPSYTFLFFFGGGGEDTAYSKSIHVHPSTFSSQQKSLTTQEFGSIFFLSTAWNLSFLTFWRLQNTAVKLLFCSKKKSQITLADITEDPSRKLQPYNTQLPIIYSMARFSAVMNQDSFLALNRVKLIYASW